MGYEALRHAVLGVKPCGWRLGHGVLAGRGMAAWMAAWPAFPAASEAGTTALDLSAPLSPSLSANATPTALSSLPGAKEIVAVLAQMALAHTR